MSKNLDVIAHAVTFIIKGAMMAAQGYARTCVVHGLVSVFMLA